MSIHTAAGRQLIVLQAPGGMHRPYKAPASVNAKHKTWHYLLHPPLQLAFNGLAVLQSACSVSHEEMLRIAHTRYETFDRQRRSAEAQEADAADLQEIEQLGKRVARRTKTTAADKATSKAKRGKIERELAGGDTSMKDDTK
jgi:hypothetical protein